MQDIAAPWSVPVAVEDIPDTGLHVVIEAPAEVRAAVAKLADVRDLPQLSAEFDLVREGAGAAVSGHVRARVGQTCVVTLDPLENAIDEPVDLLFSAVPDKAASSGETGEEPEKLVDGRIDLGALATEFLILAIDPYPRKPGAQFASPPSAEAGERPFAALAELKKRFRAS